MGGGGRKLHPAAETLVAAARLRNRERDVIDRESGFAAPSDCPLPMHLATALSAIESGLATKTWECVAEGYEILESAIARLRSAQ